jgi:hypothetical protein
MSVATEAGYTWAQGKHARLLHDGNRFPIKTVSADEDTGSTADLVDNGLTRDRWVPFANLAESPTDFDAAAWTAERVTIGTDGQTISETTDNGTHRFIQSYTWTAEEHVVAVEVVRQTVPEIYITASDGTSFFGAYFDLRDGTVGTEESGTDGQIVDLGGGAFLCSIRFTPLAAAGNINIRLANGSESNSYTGSTDNTIVLRRASVHVSAATIRLDTFTPGAGTCIAIGAHNLGSAAARVTFQHDSNGDDTWTTIGTVEPTNDSPIMFFFDEITSDRWRLVVDRGVLPEIGVVRIGDPLVFERPFYGGFSPARMDRATEVLGNISRTGELLGRSIKRTILSEAYQWTNLTYTWVRANLDGPGGVIQSLETEPAFMAWRPEIVASDVSYLMRTQTTPPQAMGTRDLWSFSMSAEVYSYE